MIRDIQGLADGEFDIVIVGGGILGAFLAYESARRGYRTALLEADDFAGGTTSSSGKVLHGGLRYLQHLEFDLVAESAREQRRIAELAPRLVRRLPFVVPVREGNIREALTMRLGAWGWNVMRPLLPSDHALSGSDFLSGTELAELLPRAADSGVSGGMRFHDYQIRSPERLTVALLHQASVNGAKVANYLEAVGFPRSKDRVEAVRAIDHREGREITVDGRMILNAAGPWGAAIAATVDGSLARMGFAKGAHVVLDRPEPSAAVALPLQPQTAGSMLGTERRVFLMPWEGRTLVGATYSPYDRAPDTVRPERSEISAFLTNLHEQWPEFALDRAKPLFAYAGLYPIFDAKANTSDDTFQASLRPRIVDHEAAGGPSGLLSAVSVKLTGAWKLADEVLTLADEKLGMVKPRPPEEGPGHLPKAHPTPLPSSAAPGKCPRGGYARDELVEMVDVAVEDEMAFTVPDFLFRRTWLGHIGCPDDDVLDLLARRMGRRLGWDDARIEEEIRRTRATYSAVDDAIFRGESTPVD